MRTPLFVFGWLAALALGCGHDRRAQLTPTGAIHAVATFPTIEARPPKTELVIDERMTNERDQYLDRLETAIDDLGVPPEALERPISEDDARALTDVDKKREILREDYFSVEQATLDEWPSLKSRVDADLDDFTRSVRSAARRSGPTSPRGR